MNSELEAYLPDFLEEASDHLQSMNTSLLSLESNPDDADALQQIFRDAHTLKGMAATMEFSGLASFCHSIEGLLDLMRKGERKADGKAVSLLFHCFDSLGAALAKIKESRLDSEFSEQDALLAKAIAGENFELKEAKRGGSQSEITAVKVPVKRLDKLLGLVGELVTARIKLHQIADTEGNKKMRDALSELDRLSDSIRDELMHARMIPLSQVFGKFPRMVRDLAKKGGKEVEIEIIGGDIEMDRTVLDRIDTPLVHMLRNSVDHGIESTGEREAAGKQKAGKITLMAKKERDHVTITLSDNGRGVDFAAVRRKLAEKGVCTQKEADSMPEHELISFLFSSGISTSEQVSDTSGRGVGLSAVKALVESLGGFVRLESGRGSGTSISMRLPLSLAIMKNLFVEVSGQTYAFPLSSIRRIVKISEKEIKTVEGEEVFILEGEDIPLLRLQKLYSLASAAPQKEACIIIVEQGISRLGLAVDSVVDEKESIVKPLENSRALGNMFSGATVLGDGSVVLIPDVSGMMRR